MAGARVSRTRLRLALLAVCAVLAYGNGLSAPFILDDSTSILTNTSIETLSGAIHTPSDTPVARRPLVNVSFAFNYALAGRDPRWYRLTNLVIHVLTALAFYGVVRRTLLVGNMDAGLRAVSETIAWVCALVWLVHPLNSEVVDYVTQRSTAFLALFYLLTIYCANRSATARAGGRWAAAAVICCAGGMLSKESMVTAPVMVVLYDRVFLFDSWKALAARRRHLYGGLAACWALLAFVIASAERTSAGFGATAANLGTTVSSWDYLLNQARMIPHYLYLSIWPRSLVVDYGFTRPIPFAEVAVPGTLMLLAVTVVGVALFVRPKLAFPAAWFFITLAPTSSFVPIATEVGAERRMYLPLAGLVVLSVIGVYRLAHRADWTGTPLRIVTAAVLALLAMGTIARNDEYTNPVRLAETGVARWPSARARVHLGTLYADRGDEDAAIREYRRAAESFPPADYMLGVALVENHQIDEGMAHLRTFIRRAPGHDAVAGARDLIGRVLIDRQDFDGASREFESLLRDDPANPRALVLLAEVRLRQQRIAEAIDLFERGRRLDAAVGRDAAMMQRYGTALAMSNRLADAERVFAEAAAAHPGDATLQKLWGRSLAAQGRFAAAAERFQRAEAIAPRDPEARELADAVRVRLGAMRR
jgi:tetratricopeptide (TPR) repeat protein